MPSNLGTIIGGPALVQFKGKTFFSKGDIQLSADLESFTVDVDAFGGAIEERESNAPLTVSFTPAGRWDALDVLWPYGSPEIGGSIVPVVPVVAVDKATDVITVGSLARLRDAAPIVLDTFGALPAGLAAATTYYVHKASATTCTLHASAADATNNANKIDITGDPTGNWVLVEQEPLVIHTLAGRKLTFPVAAVTQMPDFLGSAVQTPIGAVTFEIFRKNGVAATADGSRWASTAAALDLAAQGFDPAAIITQPYTGKWGATAPWSAFSSKTGFRVSFPIGLSPIEDDASGVIGRRLTSVRAEVRAQPTNADEDTLLAALKLQGAGAGRGRRLTGADLDLEGTGVFVRVYGATLKNAPQLFSAQQDRVGELVWSSARPFTAGAPGPVFYVGTAAPA